METKLCKRCDTIKNLDDFYNYKKSKDGKQAMCILCAKAYGAAHYPEYRDKSNARERDRYKANKTEVLKRNRAYDAAHKEQLSIWRKKYNLERKEQRTEYLKQYRDRAATKLLIREYRSRRRASMKNNPREKVDFLKIIERDNFICHICGEHIENDDVHFDHVIPLCMGGGHTYDNIKMAHSFCNLSKGGRML